jgi:hypothetical protein
MAILTNAQPEVTPTNTVTLTNKTLTAPTISDPTFTGTTTNINTTNLVVEDKNIVINDVTSPSDTNADGGGISLNGSTTKTLNWVDATDAWTSSEHLNLSKLSVGEAITFVWMNTNGATPYYPSAITIDGNAITPKFQNGVAFSAGNASSIDIYSYTIIKTAATPTYVVVASQTRFA